MYRAIIAEDEPLMRQYLKEQLNSIHPDFVAAEAVRNGLEAKNKMQEDHYDLLITDIRMPEMSGIELVQWLRGQNQYSDLAVILLSGYDEFEYARAGLRMNVFEYLLKPLNDRELHDSLERIREQLNKAQTLIRIPSEWTPESIKTFISDCFSVSDNDTGNLAKQATDYIIRHYNESITQSDVAEALGITPAYLSNIFHENTGESYMRFLTRLRMSQAALLLRSDEKLTIQQIAEMTGYLSDKHFIGVFKKFFGLTPNEFRREQ